MVRRCRAWEGQPERRSSTTRTREDGGGSSKTRGCMEGEKREWAEFLNGEWGECRVPRRRGHALSRTGRPGGCVGRNDIRAPHGDSGGMR
jgi:hypothetical protein